MRTALTSNAVPFVDMFYRGGHGEVAMIYGYANLKPHTHQILTQIIRAAIDRGKSDRYLATSWPNIRIRRKNGPLSRTVCAGAKVWCDLGITLNSD